MSELGDLRWVGLVNAIVWAGLGFYVWRLWRELHRTPPRGRGASSSALPSGDS